MFNPQSISNNFLFNGGDQTPSSNMPPSAGAPGSVIAPGATPLVNYASTPFGSIGPNSVGFNATNSVYNHHGGFGEKHEPTLNSISEYKIDSMMNLAGIPAASERIAQYPDPASVSNSNNLAVPMTPLHHNNSGDSESGRSGANQLKGILAATNSGGHNNHIMASSIQTCIPATPLSVNPNIPMPTLQNIVSTVNLGVQLDLKKIAMHARNAEYNPKRFAAVIMRIREPRTTALIFSSGKMVCTGAKSEETSRLAARKYARIIQKLGFDAKFTEFKVQNMVGSCDVKFPIQLEGLCITHAQFSTYEPELFPGLIYRMVVPRVVLLIFVSGKVVITGAKFRKDIDDAFRQIYPILKGFKK